LTADEIAKLEATIKALPDAAPSKKMSARGRRAFLYGQQTERETVLQSIAELKKRMKVTELDREDEYKYLRKHSAEVAEVLQ
jgi:flagellar motility protein MotE (MotC chaperone)